MNRAFLVAAAGVGGYLAYRALRPRYDFTGRHALITGGSRGLGLELGRQLAARGARLTLCARDRAELDRAAADLRDHGADVEVVECDVTRRDDVRRFVAAARRRFGPVDVLINNAGVIGVGPVETMTLQDFEESLATHFWACLYTTAEVVPEMAERRSGRIVNVTSLGARVALPHMLPYTAGKFAAYGYSMGLRAELARFGVTVTTVVPGLMRTGSHLNAEFKGKHEQEYAWFSLLNGIPGLSINSESAARQILAAAARGDAEAVVTLSAKLAVLGQTLFPNLLADLNAFVNRHVLPEAGGVGTRRVKGRDSRGALPEVFTVLSDRAAAANNELQPAPAGS